MNRDKDVVWRMLWRMCELGIFTFDEIKEIERIMH